MCGICGIADYNHTLVKEEYITRMTDSFVYRGPDDQGHWIGLSKEGRGKSVSAGLGHQRLSIIDLSAAGHQPMSNEDGSVWITYNGEVYNFKELKTQLIHKGRRFRSDTDTEVIIHLYEEEGIKAVEKLNGMFAFALWDQKLARLWVCRDRVGIKPLVYYWDGEKFAFASEIKALLSDPDIPRELDHDALQLYLAFNYVPVPYTIFKNIRKLAPGCFLMFENGVLVTEKYWEAPGQVDETFSFLPADGQEKIIKTNLRELLSDAVRSRMIADVPLGAFLSGGIDSSIIVALMAQHSTQPVKTFSIGFEDDPIFDETQYAREVANRYQTDHHEFKLTQQDMLDVLVDVLAAFDEPFGDSSAIPTFIVSRETQKHVTVALSGDGGDELFAGYRSYLGPYWYARYTAIPSLIRNGLIERVLERLPESRNSQVLEYIRRLKKFVKGTKGDLAGRMLSLKEVIPKNIRQAILLTNGQKADVEHPDPALAWVQSLLSYYENDELNSILYSDFKDSLPGDMLTKIDWMSMRNSLEVRVPFLDHRVVELAFKMPSSLKLRNGQGKYILKETFKDLLPASLHNRPKAGFEVPISRWLKNDLKFLADRYLAEERIRDQGLFDYEVVKKLGESHAANRSDTSWMLWNLIVFQYWYDHYLS
jgi:asparagine synthase (glutamine-hydrolysing)